MRPIIAIGLLSKLYQVKRPKVLMFYEIIRNIYKISSFNSMQDEYGVVLVISFSLFEAKKGAKENLVSVSSLMNRKISFSYYPK
ncbi:hypothetical protein CLV94_0643 [Flavobacterium endophyticum]|uniref:Uncharacterized protein n=1 Tax=Flavobacterium endophyticum TaxID=1540163 RepID=A0A495MHZ5_9FLAO|nr:hypothetical protein CLV94_0643 [Flavobacterium endophyticum]